jgi:hypothetical protein
MCHCRVMLMAHASWHCAIEMLSSPLATPLQAQVAHGSRAVPSIPQVLWILGALGAKLPPLLYYGLPG